MVRARSACPGQAKCYSTLVRILALHKVSSKKPLLGKELPLSPPRAFLHFLPRVIPCRIPLLPEIWCVEPRSQVTGCRGGLLLVPSAVTGEQEMRP